MDKRQEVWNLQKELIAKGIETRHIVRKYAKGYNFVGNPGVPIKVLDAIKKELMELTEKDK